MAFRLYAITLASITAALLLIWYLQPRLGGAGAFRAVCAGISAVPAPVYRWGVRSWVAWQRRRLGLPAASDRDLIDFVGEELDQADIVWQWRPGLRRATDADEIEIGDDVESDLSVRVRHGVLFVTDSETGTSVMSIRRQLLMMRLADMMARSVWMQASTVRMRTKALDKGLKNALP